MRTTMRKRATDPAPEHEAKPLDPRIHSSFDHLRSLASAAGRLSFMPRQPAHSVLNGRHASRLRGRGLNFEELREYRHGDDVRTLDWKVTARRGEPYVRVYTEERDRPALLIVDQRMSMFFGTQHAMKSVIAAEAAAIAAHRILAQGDRVGGIVFGDEDLREIRPRRSQNAVHALLLEIASMNGRLRADRPPVEMPMSLNKPLEAALRIARHDHLVMIFSDFDQVDERTRRQVRGLAEHNDVFLFIISDPSAMQLPAGRKIVASDGRLQMELDSRSDSAREKIQEMTRGRLARIMDWQKELGVPVLPLSTAEDALPQLRQLLGLTQSRRPR